MLAYWEITKSTDPARALASVPLTYNDALHALLVSRGIDPASGAASAPGAHRRASARQRPAASPLTVHGGAKTRAHQQAAEVWARSAGPREWSRRTNSTPAAIAWAMEPDA